MLPLDPMSSAALAASAILVLTLLALHLRSRNAARPAGREALDTVAAWQPEAARVLTATEREACDLLKRAMPGFLVLAQVPLSRFIRVPLRHSYADWLQRVGHLSADLLLCDSSSRVLAVIDVRPPQESERSRRRHERLARVLRAAGIGVHVWREGELPSIGEVRSVLGADFARHAAQSAPAPTASRPMPLIPVPEMLEVLAEGDAEAAFSQAMEPVPSAFFDDLDLPVAAPRAR